MTTASQKKRTIDKVSPPRVDGTGKKRCVSEEADTTKKSPTLEELLGDEYLRAMNEVQQVTVKGWLCRRKVWYQYYRPSKKHPDRVCMDMEELCQTKAARTCRQLLKQNLPMAIAVIGDDVPTKDKQGRILKDEQGNVKMSPTYSFAKLTLQDLVLASYQLDSTEMRFCSMSWPDLPVHGYVDIDCKVDEPGFALLHGRMHEALEELLLRMDEYHLLVLKRRLNRDHMQIGPACTDTKFSVHIQLPAEVYADLKHLLAWRDGLVQYIVTTHPASTLGQVLSQLDKLIDASVYNAFSNLKMLGCAKPGRQPIRLYDMTTRQYRTLTDMSLEQRMEALFYEQPSFALCCPKEQGINRWPCVDERAAQIKHRIERGEKITVDGLRESYFGLSLADMQAAAEEHDIELVGERHASETCVSFHTRNINAPRTCTVSGAEVEHRSWYAGCYVTKAGRLMMTCPASSCKGHRKQLLATHTMGAKVAVLWDIVDAIDKEQVKNWDATMKAMVQAGATKEQLVEVTEGTTAADLVEHSYALYSKLGPNELPRKPGPLMAVLKAQDVDKTEIDVYKLRLKGAEKPTREPQKDNHGADASHAKLANQLHTEADKWLKEDGLTASKILKRFAEWVKANVPDDEQCAFFPSLMPHLNSLFKVIEEPECVLVRKPCKPGFRWKGHDPLKFDKVLFVQHCIDDAPIAHHWFYHKDREQYSTSSNLPPLLEYQQPADSFNCWKGYPVESYPRVDIVSEGHQKLLNKLIDLIWDMCGGPKGDPKKEGFNWYCDHCTFLLKYPGKKTGCFITFFSYAQGNGKSTTGYMMRKLIGGAHSLSVEKNVESVLFGPFNGHMEGLVFIDLDDQGGSNALRLHAEDFRGMVTNPMQNIRRMRADHAPNVPAFEHYQSTANKLPVHESGARRNMIFKAGIKYQGQKEFWVELYAALNDPVFQRVVYQWFMARDVKPDTNFQLEMPKHLDGMKDMDERTVPLEVRWFIETYFSRETLAINVELKAADMLAQYNVFLARQEMKATNQTAFGGRLRDLDFGGVTKINKKAGTFYQINFPDLKKWLLEKRYMQPVTTVD